jgi:ADP-heptose:LPS heptosyltransferase
LVFVTTPAAAELVRGLPGLDEVLAYDRSSVLSWVKLVARLRGYHFDLAVNFHASYRSALLARLSGAPERVVDNFSGPDHFTTRVVKDGKTPKSAIERDLDCLRALGIEPADSRTELALGPEESAWAGEYFKKAGLGTEPVCLAPGAGRPAKRWPEERFTELAGRLADAGQKVFLLAGPGEEELAEKIAAGAPIRPVVVAGLSIRQSAALIGRCRLLVANDSAAGHIAAALGVRSLVLMGPERDWEYYPYQNGVNIALSRDVDCRVCGKYDCADKKCLTTISVDDIISQAKKISS